MELLTWHPNSHSSTTAPTNWATRWWSSPPGTADPRGLGHQVANTGVDESPYSSEDWPRLTDGPSGNRALLKGVPLSGNSRKGSPGGVLALQRDALGRFQPCPAPGNN